MHQNELDTLSLSSLSLTYAIGKLPQPVCLRSMHRFASAARGQDVQAVSRQECQDLVHHDVGKVQKSGACGCTLIGGAEKWKKKAKVKPRGEERHLLIENPDGIGRMTAYAKLMKTGACLHAPIGGPQ